MKPQCNRNLQALNLQQPINSATVLSVVSEIWFPLLNKTTLKKNKTKKKHRRKERTIHWLLAFSCISYYLIKSLLSLRRSQPILISFGMIISTCLPFNSPNRLSYMDNFIVTCCSLLSLVFITVLFFSVLLTHLHPMGQNNTSFGVEGWVVFPQHS